MAHEHRWGLEDDCEGLLSLGGRLVPCHARRCAALGCQEKRQAPIDYCRQHIYLGRRLVLPSKGTSSA